MGSLAHSIQVRRFRLKRQLRDLRKQQGQRREYFAEAKYQRDIVETKMQISMLDALYEVAAVGRDSQ